MKKRTSIGSGIYKRTKWHRDQLKKYYKTHKSNMFGKHHTLESRRKMSKSAQGKHNGPKNPAWKGGHYKTSHGYIYIWQPSHPFCNNDGYVFEHRLIMEKHLGRKLKKYEIVHHINGNRSDNRTENLVLLPKRSHDRLETTKRWQDHKNGVSLSVRPITCN
ncbi:MAG: HNH endonuclease signature motif containing protein, partial [Patescibacteria group bacterium]